MKLLAIDQGSNAIGFAYFDLDDVKPHSTDWVRAPAGRPWIEKMKYIDQQLRAAARARRWAPEVVAIEDVVLNVRRDLTGRAQFMNVPGLITMGETRGWLMRTCWELFPEALRIDINPSSTKAAARARSGRVAAKADIAQAVKIMTGLTGLGEDEADAVAIGWAAFGKLRERSWQELADQQQRLRMGERGMSG